MSYHVQNYTFNLSDVVTKFPTVSGLLLLLSSSIISKYMNKIYMMIAQVSRWAELCDFYKIIKQKWQNVINMKIKD